MSWLIVYNSVIVLAVQRLGEVEQGNHTVNLVLSPQGLQISSVF